MAVATAGGALGGIIGSRVAAHLAQVKGALNIAFAALILIVALYMASRTLSAFF